MDKKQLLESLREKGFDEKIISAFKKVRREDFFQEQFKEFAYEDSAFPIGYGQTISQPYTIAFMLDLLELKDNLKILEIGSGSGYVLALIANISKNSEIYGIERIKELTEKSKKILKNYKNIKIIHGNGLNEIKKLDKFDRVLVSASAKEIPEELIEKLKENGILVMPINNDIVKLKKLKNKNIIEEYEGFVFVPLVNY